MMKMKTKTILAEGWRIGKKSFEEEEGWGVSLDDYDDNNNNDDDDDDAWDKPKNFGLWIDWGERIPTHSEGVMEDSAVS